jgi:hypothetical protein
MFISAHDKPMLGGIDRRFITVNESNQHHFQKSRVKQNPKREPNTKILNMLQARFDCASYRPRPQAPQAPA